MAKDCVKFEELIEVAGDIGFNLMMTEHDDKVAAAMAGMTMLIRQSFGLPRDEVIPEERRVRNQIIEVLNKKLKASGRCHVH